MSGKRIVGTFRRHEDLVAAATAVRGAGLTIEDAFSPYPVPGLADAMGLSLSRLGWVCFFAGMGAAMAMLGLEIWVSTVAWPLNFGGKPDNALPAFIPPAFEFGILCGALATVAALLLRSRLYPGKRPWLPAPGISDDRFALVVDAGSATAEAGRLVTRHGGTLVPLPGEPGR